ncbi:MAG: XRE family transcriptional regulator, partial [Anaerolineales bacterium]|nr:XRE family transcriptional regulator [Anaerolineales bacterium]
AIVFMMNSDTFSDWLQRQIDTREWSQSELARNAKINQASVSNILSEKRLPGYDFCLAIADAFNMPPEAVLRIAGLLPPVPEETALQRRVEHLFNQLSQPEQQEILDYIEYRLQKSEQRKKGTGPLQSAPNAR